MINILFTAFKMVSLIGTTMKTSSSMDIYGRDIGFAKDLGSHGFLEKG